MKIKEVTYIITLISLLKLSAGCEEKKTVIFTPQKACSFLSPEQTFKAGKILQHYFQLKDALVVTKSQDADLAAKKMKIAILDLRQQWKNADSTSIPSETVLQSEMDTMLLALDTILSVADESCERKRIPFKTLSDMTYRFLKDIHIKNIETYHQYCPMAMNEQGGWWLSTSPEIENPYFGKKMLTCGEVVDTIE